MPKINNKKSKSRIIALVAVIVVVLLVLSSVFVYYQYFAKEEKVQEKEEEFKVDERISPLENQAVVLEVLRIRHRGLYDKLLTRGNSWKTKPVFSYKVNIDDLEYVNKRVFNTWDTMGQENKIIKDVEEEQKTSKITITLFEEQKYGFLKRKTRNVEKDSITVNYDYRTGRWYSEDDYFKDKDGYGHYLGDTFEIWFNIYQTDYDDDYIPYWTEVNILGTDPMRDDSNLDPDGDGIPTSWEWKWGYDPFTWDDHVQLDPDIDGVENIEEYKMAKWFSDPFAQDIYLEIDYMGKTGFFDPAHVFWEESQQAIIEQFSQHNIRLYIDYGWTNGPKNGGGQVVPHTTKMSQDSGIILQYYNNYFPPERRGIFRYVVVSHSPGFNHPAIGNVYDCFVAWNLVGAKYRPSKQIYRYIVLGIRPGARGMRISLAGSTMHELGHSCGIHPYSIEGCDNASYGIALFPNKTYKETWGQYVSVMNYLYTHNHIQYSNGKNGPPYDQNDWLKLFIPEFQYNDIQVEDPKFKPPGYDKLVYGEPDFRVTDYMYDENLTINLTKKMGDFSPVDPIQATWAVFRLIDKEKNPNYKEIKVLVIPKDVTTADWVQYAEGELDSNNDIQFYSQDAIIDNVMDELN